MIWKNIVVAFSLFSALPMPQVRWSKRNMRYSLLAFPLVGAMIGGLCWLWVLLCRAWRFPELLQGAGLCLLPVLLTGGVFGVAGAIMAENSLSFLGFGVQPPGASWGDLLRQAFANPIDYWHLTLFPGAAIFLAVISFNFIGDGIGKAISPK